MDLTHEFVVPLPLEDAWAVLTDLERVAPCMPGAQLEEVEGDEYRGKVRVKVGPITAEYRGVASFVERDASSHTAVLRAQGRETRGQGNASATVTARLLAEGDGATKVAVDTALDVTGRVAQFGRGALSDVSAKLLGQFVDNLERDLASSAAPRGQDGTAPAEAGEPAPAAATGESSAPESGPRRIEHATAEPVRLISLVGPSLLKRLSPVALIGAIVLALRRWVQRRRRSE